MSVADNLQIALEEQQKANALNKSQKSDVDAKKKGSQKKTKAAMFSQLNDLTMNLLATRESASQYADKQALKDKKLLNKLRLGGVSPTNDPDDEKKASNADKTTAPTSTTKKPSMFDLVGETPDPLIALVMAGITIQEKTNAMITSLATAGEEISDVTTKAAKAGNDWMKDFYSHGVTAGNPGSTDDSTTTKQYFIVYYEGSYYVKPYGDGTAPTWENGGSGWTNIGKNPNLTAGQKKYLQKHSPAYGDFKDYKYAITTNNSNGIPGATGTAHSAEFNELMGIWQYVQQQVSQLNNQFQTVAGLPSTMMQTLTQSISTANSGQSATIQAMGTTTSLVNGWAGV